MRNLAELRKERLRVRLTELDSQLRFRELGGVPDAPWYRCAKSSQKLAEDALEGDRSQVAWAHCAQAFRFLLYGCGPEALAGHAKALRREAIEKLKNWRKDAVLDLLGQADGGKPDLDNVALAQSIMDQHFENVYFKIEVVAARARLLPWALGLLVVLAVTIPTWFSASAGVLVSRSGIALIMFLGATGAAVSNVLTSLSSEGRIPQIVRGESEGFVRLFVGALSALVVVLVLQSGVLPVVPPEGVSTYPYALVAGFTDQLLNRVIRSVERSVEA